MASHKDDERYNEAGCWNMLEPEEGEDWLERSRVSCAYPDANIYVAHSSHLRDRLPAAAAFLEQVAMTPDMVSGWILLARDYDTGPAVVARLWISANSEVVDQWMAGIE